MKLDRDDIIQMLHEETAVSEIDEFSQLREDIGMTSLQMLAFITRLSEVSGISFKLTDVMQWRTVGDVLKTQEEQTDE